MTSFLAQSSGLSFLVYLIVGALWLVGNLMQAKQAKKKALEMRRKRLEREEEEKRTGRKPPEKTSSVEREIESFLERLAGGIAPAAAPPPMPKARTREAEIQFDGPPPPPPTPPKPRTPPPAPARAPARNYDIGELDMAASFKQITDIKEATEVIGEGLQNRQQQEALQSVRSMMVDLSSSSLAVPRIRLQSIRAIQTRTNRPDLRNRKQFRKALAASVILGPPKALQEKPFTETP
ncbi:MAG: hypothetical protein ACO3N7_11840 [Kiritimatiellia bacterium]